MSDSPQTLTAPLLPQQLSRLLLRLDPGLDDSTLALVCELAAANQAGHVCLPIAHRAERRLLQASPVLGAPGSYAPLILDAAGRLYFARHWFDEQSLAHKLAQLAADHRPLPASTLEPVLHQLFPALPAGQPDRQKLAAALAARQRLLVVSGGPGTGKTTTVVRLLAMLAMLAERPQVMAMAAPTGKAAARLSESVRNARDSLPVADSVRAQLPQQAQTLHRLLGLRPGAAQPRYHAGQPLPLDVLVVDEASMIDLALMARLVEALPAQARLILLGDRDQLASVDAGAVLGDLCGQVAYLPATRDWLAQAGAGPLPADEGRAGALADSVVLLTHSHRFRADSGIGELARLVNLGDATAALQLLQAGQHDDIRQAALLDDAGLLARRQPYLDAIQQQLPLAQVQAAFAQFMLLAAERRQVEQANQRMEALLEQRACKQAGRDWYAGRPVMISANDYGVGLFNGDIGFTVERPQGLRVAFPAADGSWREFAPGRLPQHETVFAMTVHKSQGSEFDEVWLQLPATPGPVLNRALIYTAITRARQRFAVAGSDEVWQQAVRLAPARYSGLADLLRQPRV
ncbi:exodeoxyribonuclease V subunit alpha [Aquitalea palustris]|uniref:RecBCD enzyme subunit RecD n=1 Tax=Aquitalea palustris TaxID=2480983 RepID=A0A454JFF9_9NEIS|nr:exodeoxyribonuclease V subunit alpha [Aquitalea palustris]RMC94370.1 exodeoxyribonuclease V subunit alpha [Aquitalea palustris]